MRHQDDLCAASARRAQHIQHILCRAGIGKKQNHIVRRGERRGHGLHVGVLDALELGCGCNETRPCLHGNDQASPLSEAVDPLCGGKIFHCPAHVLLVDLRQRLANGRHVRGIQLFAHVGNAVLRQDLSIDADLVIRRRGAAGLCKGQLVIIVTGKAQRTAEP